MFVSFLFFFFFFKQKTAYEMRISDWSSDVCSSDLQGRAPVRVRAIELVLDPVVRRAATVLRHVLLVLAGVAVQRHAVPEHLPDAEIGRASCRERVCQYV